MPIDSEQPILIRSTDVDLIQKVKELHVQTFTRDGHDPLGLALVDNDVRKHQIWMERTIDQAVLEMGAFAMLGPGNLVKGFFCVKWPDVNVVDTERDFGAPLTKEEMAKSQPFFDHADQVEAALIHPDFVKRSIFFRCFAIHPDYRRQGLAKELSDWFGVLAELHKAPITFYIVEQSNVGIWEKLGFKIRGPMRIESGDWGMNYWGATYITPSSGRLENVDDYKTLARI